MNTLSVRVAALVALLALALTLPEISGGSAPGQTPQTPTATSVGKPIDSTGPAAVVATNSPIAAGATAPAGESAIATPTSPASSRPGATTQAAQSAPAQPTAATALPQTPTPTTPVATAEATEDPLGLEPSPTPTLSPTATAPNATTTTQTPTPTATSDSQSRVLTSRATPSRAALRGCSATTPCRQLYLPALIGP